MMQEAKASDERRSHGKFSIVCASRIVAKRWCSYVLSFLAKVASWKLVVADSEEMTIHLFPHSSYISAS
jgi:hypothetical protein